MTTPRFRRLADQNLLTPPTLAALAAREPAFDGEPRRFDAPTFAILVALVDVLRPYERPSGREIALRIDARLAKGECDGWRFDAMPADAEAYAQGLAALAQEGALDASVVRRLQRGETTVAWPLSPQRFLEDLLAEVATFAYSQPEAQDAIGYDGYADAQGWSHIALGDAREDWE